MHSKFCSNCSEREFLIHCSRARALRCSQHSDFVNSHGRSLWSSKGWRVVNHTKRCSGPRLIIFKAFQPPEGDWAEIPPEWISTDTLGNFVIRLISKNGTLCPAASGTLSEKALPPATLASVSQHTSKHALKRVRDESGGGSNGGDDGGGNGGGRSSTASSSTDGAAAEPLSTERLWRAFAQLHRLVRARLQFDPRPDDLGQQTVPVPLVTQRAVHGGPPVDGYEGEGERSSLRALLAAVETTAQDLLPILAVPSPPTLPAPSSLAQTPLPAPAPSSLAQTLLPVPAPSSLQEGAYAPPLSVPMPRGLPPQPASLSDAMVWESQGRVTTEATTAAKEAVAVEADTASTATSTSTATSIATSASTSSGDIDTSSGDIGTSSGDIDSWLAMLVSQPPSPPTSPPETVALLAARMQHASKGGVAMGTVGAVVGGSLSRAMMANGSGHRVGEAAGAVVSFLLVWWRELTPPPTLPLASPWMRSLPRDKVFAGAPPRSTSKRFSVKGAVLARLGGLQREVGLSTEFLLVSISLCGLSSGLVMYCVHHNPEQLDSTISFVNGFFLAYLLLLALGLALGERSVLVFTVAAWMDALSQFSTCFILSHELKRELMADMATAEVNSSTTPHSCPSQHPSQLPL